MTKSLPNYVENTAKESGDLVPEVLIGLVEATETQTEAIREQTKALERIAHVLEDVRPWVGRSSEV